MGLKIAMVTPWGKVRCGIRTYSEALTRGLVEQDVDVYVVRLPRFGRQSTELLQLVVDQVPVDKVDLVHIQYESGLYQMLEGSFFSGLRKLGKPVVTTCHSVGNLRFDSIVASNSDLVIVHNEWCRRKIQCSKENVTVVPHGCSPTETPPMDECKKMLGVDSRIPVVGYQGFISPPKGIETLIEAMHAVPNVALVIGGGWFTEGASETRYITQLKQHSLEVLPGRCQWLGYVPENRLPFVYGSMSCLVYPSRFATASGALRMGLSHGRATIASALPPFKEIRKAGALITFKNVKDLRRKIKRLLTDDGLRHKLEEAARKFAYKNRWEVIAQRHLKLYEDVIEKDK